MSDQAYGTRPGGEQGGGTPNASGQEVLAQKDGQSAGQEPQGNEQVVVTRKDLEAWAQRIKEEAIEESTKRAQSMTDKMGSRLDKEIQGALEQATNAIELGKQAGMKYTPEQEQAIRDKAINAAYTKLNQPGQSSPQSSEPPVLPGQQDAGPQSANPLVWVNQEVQRIMTETGVFIPPEEANQLIVGEGGDTEISPYQYIQAFESLARQRQSNTRQPTGLNPAIPSYVQGGKSSETQTALRSQYQKEIEQIKAGTHPSIKRGETNALQQMENEYRRKGLEF